MNVRDVLERYEDLATEALDMSSVKRAKVAAG